MSGPWEESISVLTAAWTGSVGRGLALICIVLGGCAGFGEGRIGLFDGTPWRVTAGRILFGLGVALGTAQFMMWLYGV